MWIKANPNPLGKEVPDCVIRAICIATRKPWLMVYDELTQIGRYDCDMPSSDAVWGHYLYLIGFKPFLLERDCPRCVTVERFAQMHPEGTYIIGTGSHAVTVINGDYYDSWDSGDQIASFFWRAE